MADYRFGGELIGLETRPEYTSYEVPETMATDDDGTGSTGETGTENPRSASLTEKSSGSTENTGSAQVM